MLKRFPLALLFLTGLACSVGPVGGIIYTDISFAGDTNARGGATREKRGESCQNVYLGLVAIGQAGAGDAARAGGVTRIASIDHRYTSVFGWTYARYCTIVKGE